ncbi:TolC family protein [Flavihumibacter stibioxidans]|nr:TolC family protein [Flavihumibacter stibioxidans]
MKHKLTINGLLVALLLGSATMAQDSQPEGATAVTTVTTVNPDSLSLSAVIRLALEHNQTLRKATLSEEAGIQKTREIKAQALPQVNLNGNYSNNFIKPVIVLPGELTGQPGTISTIEMGTTHNIGITGEVKQELFNQSVFTGLQAARKSEEYYRLQTRLTEDQVIQSVASAFYQLQVNRVKREIVDSNMISTRKILTTTETQFKAGLARRIDVDRLRVNLANLESMANLLNNAIYQSENQLRYFMGMQMDDPLQFSTPSLANIQEEMNTVLQQESNEIMQLNDFKLLKKQEELLHLQKKAYKAEYYPKLSLFGNYSYNGISNKFDLLKTSGTSTWYDVAAVGLRLSVPIFDGNARQARIAQSNIQIKQLQEDLSQKKSQLTLNQRNAKMQIANSISTIRQQEKNIILARDIYETTQSNYKLGLSPLTDLLNAETSLTQARNNHAEALLQFKLAQVEMLKSNGNLQSLTQQ